MMEKMDCGLQTSNGLNQREGIFCCMSDHISNHNFCEFVIKRHLKSIGKVPDEGIYKQSHFAQFQRQDNFRACRKKIQLGMSLDLGLGLV